MIVVYLYSTRSISCRGVNRTVKEILYMGCAKKDERIFNMKNYRFIPLTLSLLMLLVAGSGCRSLSSYSDRPQQGSATPVISGSDEDRLKTSSIEEGDFSGSMEPNTETEQLVEDMQNVEEGVEKELPNLTNQELVDTALEYCQASNDFWEQGDFENAIDCLDKAYSYTLRVDGSENAVILQEKEDLRYTISKRIIEVYSSRYSVANGKHKAIPLDMNEHVEKALELFKGRERKFFMEAYARSGKYRPRIVSELKKAGLPEELSWLPLIESGYKVRALSSARALGMWQFIASTGYKFGLKRDNWIDERMDPEKSTAAAIAYLTELHNIFGEWTTALASYNCGERRVLNRIREQKINYLDNFWDLYERLPRETAFYVPKFLAVLHIVNNPEAHGFTLPPLEDELLYEDITINKQLLLKTIATELDVSDDLIKELNPELRQNMTPGSTYTLKVPRGKGEMLMARIDDIPVYRPPVPAYVTHTVKRGESLSVIADRYHASINSIMELNGLRSRNLVRAGSKLKIPTGKYTPGAAVAASENMGSVEYIVQRGDSLWGIAKRYNTNINSIKAINKLTSNNLVIGQRLQISSELAGVQSNETLEYIVKSGDSPYLIARKHRMNLSDFLKLNKLTANSKIFPGQKVQVTIQ